VLTFDKKASSIIEDALVNSNCNVLKNTTVTKIISKDEKINGVILKTGQQLNCQLLIIAIGVHPNLDLVKYSTLKTNRGLLVNNTLQTNDPNIYAAGDVAEINGSVVAILPLASHQGRIAGYNMAGGKKCYEGNLPMNSVELAGIPTISVGLTDPKDHPEDFEILEKYLPAQKVYRKMVLKDNVIIGVILVNEIDRAGIITGMIKDKTDVALFKNHLISGNFGLIVLPKELRKHLVQGPGIEI
jgi:NAD(P)H-nitrite reductase large subunit